MKGLKNFVYNKMPVFIVFEWYNDEFRKSMQRRIVAVYSQESSADSKVSELINTRYLNDKETIETTIEDIQRRGIRDPKTKKVSHVIPKHLTLRLERELASLQNYTTWLNNISEIPYYEEHRLTK